jgi:hypothetical protein
MVTCPANRPLPHAIKRGAGAAATPRRGPSPIRVKTYAKEPPWLS